MSNEALCFLDSLSATVSYCKEAIVNKDWSDDNYGEAFSDLSYIVRNLDNLDRFSDTLQVIPLERVAFMLTGDVDCLGESFWNRNKDRIAEIYKEIENE